MRNGLPMEGLQHDTAQAGVIYISGPVDLLLCEPWFAVTPTMVCVVRKYVNLQDTLPQYKRTPSGL